MTLIYAAELSKMPVNEYGEAIMGMSTCMRIAGRAAGLDFEDVYIYPLEEGSIKTYLIYVKQHRKELGLMVVGGVISSTHLIFPRVKM